MIVRPYTDDDRKLLERFVSGIQGHISTIDPLLRTRPAEEFSSAIYVDNLLRKVLTMNGVILLGEMNGIVAGCVAGIIKEATEEDLVDLFPFRHGRVLELFVDPAFRGQKIGPILLHHMEEYFRQQHCTVSELGCIATNVVALQCYRKAGYTDGAIDLYKQL